jgi:hypothetical protein
MTEITIKGNVVEVFGEKITAVLVISKIISMHIEDNTNFVEKIKKLGPVGRRKLFIITQKKIYSIVDEASYIYAAYDKIINAINSSEVIR